MILSIKLTAILTAIVWFIVLLIILFLIAWYLVSGMKKFEPESDLIYLGMLIKNSIGSDIDKKFIQEKLNEYNSRPEYAGERLNELNNAFKEKYERN